MTTRWIIAALLLLAAGPGARADETLPDPHLGNVLAAATLDFNGDAEQDRAVLVSNGDGDADLYLYLSAPDPQGGAPALKLAFVKKAVVFAGPMWGQTPSLDVNGRGSLILRSTNSAVGRDKWDQSLAVVYRDKDFLIAGITYTVHDGLDPKGGGNCDLNLLSGRGSRDGKPAAGKLEPIRLADWSDDKLPAPCQF